MKSLRFELDSAPERPSIDCARCERALAPGAPCFRGITQLTARDCPSMDRWLRRGALWYHPLCALDVNLDELAFCLRREPEGAPLDEVRAAVRARVKAINASKRARKGVSFKVASVAAIDPSVDPAGRPRVTVAYFGSVASAGESQPSPLRDFARDDIVRTARREYIFELFSGDATNRLAVDPSRPLVGAVFAVFAHMRLVKLQRDKLALLRAFGVRTPVLWLVGPELSDAEKRDRKVLELREALHSAGFDGDEATVICTEDSRAEVLDELGRALDELDSEHRAPLRLEDRFERAVAAIETGLAQRSEHALGALIEALPVARSTDPAIDARAIDAVIRCLSVVTARNAALLRMLAWAVTEPRDALMAVVRAALTEPGRGPHPDLAHAYALLGDEPDRALFDAWASALEHEANKSAARSLDLQARLAQCDDDAIGERVERWADALGARDKRKASAAALAAKIRDNAAKRSTKKRARARAAPAGD